MTGVGKSGIIARKIAGTLSSLGTLAIFLHPTDALHGDLGIVRENDIVLAVAKSGESDELLDMLPSINEIGAKIISIVGKQDSKLARAFGATHTPHVFVFNAEGKLVYRGAIDDDAKNPDKVEETYLADALDACLAGKPVKTTSSKALGCSIKFVK